MRTSLAPSIADSCIDAHGCEWVRFRGADLRLSG
jgi:hypothetical protein